MTKNNSENLEVQKLAKLGLLGSNTKLQVQETETREHSKIHEHNMKTENWQLYFFYKTHSSITPPLWRFYSAASKTIIFVQTKF